MGVIRTKRQVGSIGPVGVVRARSSGQFQRIAAATNKLTELAVGEMGRQAAKRGKELAEQESVSRITTLDPITNKPQALSWIGDNDFVGRVGKQAYEETIAKRFQFEIDNKLKTKAKELAIKYQFQDGGSELFKDQMHQYIDNMATASEATGYSNYIMQSGVSLVTTTSLNMMDKEAARERIKTTNSIILGLDEQLDAIETLTSAGETDKAQLLIDDILKTAKNAEGSNHLTASQRKAFEDNSATRFAIGTLRSRMAGLTSTQAETVLRAIASGSAVNLNEQQHSEELNILSDALRYFKRTSKDGTDITDYDGIRALAPIVEQQKLEIQRQEKEQRVSNNLIDTENYEAMASSARILGGNVLDSEESPQNKKKLILDKYDAAETELDSRELDESRKLGSAITTAQKQELRTEISKGLLIAAYDDLQASGLSPAEIVDSLKGSFIRRTTDRLTGKANTAMSTVIELTNRGAMSAADIDEFINDLSDTDFRTTEKYKQKQRTLVSDRIKSYTENVSTQYDEGVEFITNTKFLSETQRQAALTNFQRAKSDNIIGNAITDQTTSSGLQAAMNYAVNGIEENLPPELKAAVDEALNFTNKEAIASQLNVRQTIIEGVEADTKAIQESINIRTDLIGENFIERNSANAKEIQDFILETAGMGEEFFFSEEAFNPNNTGALLLSKSMQAGIIPPALKQMFNDLAEGRVRGSEADLNILTLYEQFSKQPRGQNAEVNLFSGLGMDETSARLEVISNVRKITKESIGNISLRLKQAFQDPNIRQTMETDFANHFKNKTKSKSIDANDFVRFAVPDAKTNPQAINMLGSFARYMGALGTDMDIIESNLQDYYNGMFSDTEGYVIDVASERGERSRYSFNHLFSNKKVKDFFINKVNNELMNLMIDTSTPNDSRIALRLSTEDIDNRAFLMPMGVSQGGGVRFMAVFRNNGNLVPVLDKTGYPIGFSTSEPDVVAFAKSINKESYLKTLGMDEINDIRRNKITADEIIDSTQSGPEQGYIVQEDAQDSPYAGAGMN